MESEKGWGKKRRKRRGNKPIGEKRAAIAGDK